MQNKKGRGKTNKKKKKKKYWCPLEGGGAPIRPRCSWLSGVEASDGGELSTARAQSTAADRTAAVDVDSLARQPGACQRDEAAGLKVDSDSSMGVAGQVWWAAGCWRRVVVEKMILDHSLYGGTHIHIWSYV